MEKWLVIYDKKDLGFIYDFTRETKHMVYEDFQFFSFDENNVEKMTLIKPSYSKIFIAIWDTDKVIKCVSNISFEVIHNCSIFSSSTTNLFHFGIKPIIHQTLNGYYIELYNEILFGKVNDLALPAESIACYDYDNKRSVCLDEFTHIWNVKDAKPGSYLPSYGIQKNVQWRKNKLDSLLFSNLALREAVKDRDIFIEKPNLIYYVENGEKYYGDYYSYSVNISDDVVFALAGVVEIEGKLEINNGKSTAILIRIIQIKLASKE